KLGFQGEGVGLMEPESENRDLVHVEASSTPKTETDADVAPLIRKVGATSIAEIEKLIGELQATKNFLQSEADRIEREMARYMNLTQMASASVKIIFDTVSGWRPATPCANSRSCAPSSRTAPVAWNTPSIKGRNAGFRPTGRSRPNRSCKGRAEQFSVSLKKSPAGAGPRIRGFFQQYSSSVSPRCGTSMAD